MVMKMNHWWIDGCRTHREEIVVHLNEAYAGLSWTDVSIAAANAAASGLMFVINPLDICGSIVDEAIRRAENALGNR